MKKGQDKVGAFNVIDVETANADYASICQIGIVHVQGGEVRDTWETFIDPEDWFDGLNVAIHGIDEKTVRGAPILPEVRDELRRRLRGSVLISHTAFDRVAFERAMKRYDLEQLQVTWLDSARIARRAWPDKYKVRGWGLKNIAEDLNISFKHHNALEDAMAATKIVFCACDIAGLDIEGWLHRVKQPILPSKRRKQKYGSVVSVAREGNSEGVLYGETVVFTGKLGITRREAADFAANVGCNVAAAVTKKITMLVVGIQDEGMLRGYEKSSKHRKVENLINQGVDIRILSEKDFCELANLKY